MSCYSYFLSDALVDLLRSMFLDTTIAEKLCLQKEKRAYFINYIIAPHFRSILVNNVKDPEFYTILFDGSTNTVIQMGQMDLVVIFWDNG